MTKRERLLARAAKDGTCFYRYECCDGHIVTGFSVPSCAPCRKTAYLYRDRWTARKRMRGVLGGFNIHLRCEDVTYLMASSAIVAAKAGHSKDVDRRVQQIRKATGLKDLMVVCAVADPDFEQEVLRRFGRRDPWYDGDGKTEWPLADLATLIEFYLANDGEETWAAEILLNTVTHSYHVPELDVVRFQAITDPEKIKEALVA
jgi:hypothetical protein